MSSAFRKIHITAFAGDVLFSKEFVIKYSSPNIIAYEFKLYCLTLNGLSCINNKQT